jgi:hypothetical protein
MEKNILDLRFTKDKPVMVLAVISGMLAFLNVILTFARLRSNDFKVPVQYVVHDGSVLQTSNWYSLYSLALFSVLSAGAMIFLAHRLHKANRLFAAATLAVYIVIGLVTLLATNALLGLVGRV